MHLVGEEDNDSVDHDGCKGAYDGAFDGDAAIVDCKWVPWSKWSACLSTCGPGTRSRKLHGIPPEYGGLGCWDAEGNTIRYKTEEEACTVRACDGWSFLFSFVGGEGRGLACPIKSHTKCPRFLAQVQSVKSKV